MPSKNATITEDVCDRLKTLKRQDESFSELVVRLMASTDPMAFTGSCPGLAEHVEAADEELRRNLDEKHDELFR